MSCGCQSKCATVVTHIGNAPCGFSVCDNAGRDVEFVPLDAFLPRVRLIAKGAPDEIALEYIGQAAFEFAVKTRILKRELLIDVQESVQDYYINSGEAEQVHLVQSIEVDCGCGCASCAIETGYCANQNPVFDFLPPDKVWLKRVPECDVEAGIKVHYVAAPTQSACEVDRLLFDRHQDVIVSGALSHLLLMAQYDFAAPQLAGVYEQRFARGVNQAKIDVAREFKTHSRHLMSWSKV